jgi:hypothetical protein
MEQSCTGASMDTCGEGVNIGRADETPHGGKGGLGHVWYGYILARPDQEDETVCVVRSCAWFPPEMPYAWLPLQDFGDLLRWKASFKAGVGRAEDIPQKLPPIQGFYHDLHLPGPKWRFSAFEQWML